MYTNIITKRWANLTKYGRRYYDAVCQCCCYPGKSVFLFHGTCFGCMVRKNLAYIILGFSLLALLLKH